LAERYGKKTMEMKSYLKWLDEVDKSDMSLVGSKFTNLGKILKMELNVPFGFCITTEDYKEFGLPTVVNVKDASNILKDGQEIVVDREEGKVFISKTGKYK
jgi:phosphoenolpyruvate synthase/pyruvate phosphate dikinase